MGRRRSGAGPRTACRPAREPRYGRGVRPDVLRPGRGGSAGRVAGRAPRLARVLRPVRFRTGQVPRHRGAGARLGRALPGALADRPAGSDRGHLPLRQAFRRPVSARARPLVGVLGGMGPAASVDLYAKLVAATQATGDRDHVRVIIDGDPHVPDRQAAIAGSGPSAGPEIVAKALRLKAAGAEVLTMACHAAHAYRADVERATELPFISLIEVAVEEAVRAAPKVAALGLLATPATLDARLYVEPAARLGRQLL